MVDNSVMEQHWSIVLVAVFVLANGSDEPNLQGQINSQGTKMVIYQEKKTECGHFLPMILIE